MITNTKPITNNEDYIEIQLNYTINLKIYKKIINNKLNIDYDFDKTLITSIEAKEIVDYFIASEASKQ